MPRWAIKASLRHLRDEERGQLGWCPPFTSRDARGIVGSHFVGLDPSLSFLALQLASVHNTLPCWHSIGDEVVWVTSPRPKQWPLGPRPPPKGQRIIQGVPMGRSPAGSRTKCLVPIPPLYPSGKSFMRHMLVLSTRILETTSYTEHKGKEEEG